MSHLMDAANQLAQQTLGAAADPAEEDCDISGAVALFSALLTQLAPYAPSPAAMARWRGMIPDEEARVDGVTVSSDRVIAAAMTEFAALVPHLLQAPLPGYGPRRAYYAVNLALQHAKAYAAFLRAARGAHDAERTSHRLESDELNTFDGRLWFELEALQRAAERARNEGRKVPAVQPSALAGRRSGRAAGSDAGDGTTALSE